MLKSWFCEGVTKNGLVPDNQNPKEPHERYENFGSDCVICNLTREQVVGEGGTSLPIVPIVGGVIGLALLGTVGFLVLRPCPAQQVKAFGIICREERDSGGKDQDNNGGGDQEEENNDGGEDQEQDDNEGGDQQAGERSYNWEPERFAWGNRTLFPGIGNSLRNQGIEAFKQGNWAEAVQLFERAVDGDRNDPEPLIFYNNALAYQKGEPLTLAVVVPVDNNQSSAQQMLRGVAQAQNELNSKGGVNGRFVEIVIANDGNDPEIATEVAKMLKDDPSVLGVIGHNSSGATQAGLEIYQQAGLPVISPTSTSTTLEGDVFFRTIPSDAAAGEKLARYASEELSITKVVIFYNPGSSYSSSLKDAFVTQFSDLGGETTERNMTANLNAIGEVNQAERDGAEALLLFPDTAYVSVAIELANVNFDLFGDDRLRLLGGDALYGFDSLRSAGRSFKGLVLAIPWFADEPDAADFVEAGNNQWRGTVNWRSAMSYDAAQAFFAALSEDASRDSVLNQLQSTDLSSDKTSGRRLQFTPEGERQGDSLLVEVDSDNAPSGLEFGYSLIDFP